MSTTRLLSRVLGVTAVALFAASASAQQRPEYGTPVTTDQAKKIAAAVIAECQSNKWNVAVAVVDTAGRAHGKYADGKL
jgi:hypothetical protein